MQNTVISGQDKRISSRILLSDVVIRRSFGPGSVPVPVVGRHSSTQSRASPSLRPGLQSPVPALGRRTGGQSQSPAALCVPWGAPPAPENRLASGHRLRHGAIAGQLLFTGKVDACSLHVVYLVIAGCMLTCFLVIFMHYGWPNMSALVSSIVL